jgi:hypothetical protein
MRSQRTAAAPSTRHNRVLGGLCGLCVLVCVTIVSADTLVLRDGSRVEGTIVGMRDGVIEFEARRGFLGRERMRVERDDVVRIEFDRSGDDRRGLDRDRGDSRDRNDGSVRSASIRGWVGKIPASTSVAVRRCTFRLAAVFAGDRIGRTVRPANTTRRATTPGRFRAGRRRR